MAFYVDFGHVRIPRDLNVPPSLRMLGIEPQSKLNCEVRITMMTNMTMTLMMRRLEAYIAITWHRNTVQVEL